MEAAGGRGVEELDLTLEELLDSLPVAPARAPGGVTVREFATRRGISLQRARAALTRAENAGQMCSALEYDETVQREVRVWRAAGSASEN